MVFVKRERRDERSFNVGVTMKAQGSRFAVTQGQVGIEVEVEGKKLVKEPPAPWVYHQDGSLRGADNAEYVLNGPIAFDAVDGSLDTLWAKFEAAKSEFDESNRTSVHVHLNVQPFFLNQLTSFMAIYFTFEEVLTEWCGEHRVGNLFCLRAKDAPAIISQIRRFIRSDMQAALRDHHHYAGLNANAIHKFGSLEVRTLRGVSNPEIIKQWVKVLRRIYDLSAEFLDPREFVGGFSAMGPMDFFDSTLGDSAAVIRAGITMSSDDITDSLMTGVRMAQDLCYARDWSLFKPIEFEPDPFQRDPKQMMNRIAGGGFQAAMQVEQTLAVMEQWGDNHFAPQPPVFFGDED